jgi:hypothetical protein
VTLTSIILQLLSGNGPDRIQEKDMYKVTHAFHTDTPIFEGSKKECRKFLQAKVSGRLRKAINCNWDDERNVFCWCTQTDRAWEVIKV